MHIYKSVQNSLETILFFAYDVGAYGAIEKLLPISLQKGFCINLVLDGPAHDFFKKAQFFEQFTPTQEILPCNYGVITGSSAGILEKSLWESGHIPKKSVYIFEGWGTFGGFFNNAPEILKDLISIICPDILAEEIIKGITHNQVSITRFNAPLTPGIDPPKNSDSDNILYLFGFDEPEFSESINAYTFTQTLNHLSILGQKLGKTFTVRARLHPGYPSPFLEQFLDNALPEKILNVTLIDARNSKIDLLSALSHSKYILSINSTETYRAHYSNRVGILLWFPEFEHFSIREARKQFSPQIQNVLFSHPTIKVAHDFQSLQHALLDKIPSEIESSYHPEKVMSLLMKFWKG